MSEHIKSEVELDLVSLEEGSPAAVLGFEQKKAEPRFYGMDFGQEILESALTGLEAVQASEMDEGLPEGYDARVLMAWREAGSVFKSGIDEVGFTLNRPERTIRTSFTPGGVARIRERIGGPRVNLRTVEGRLLMADFKEHGTRCRVHPSTGEPILCLFDESLKDEILADILRYVRITGEAREEAASGKITSIRILDIESLEERKEDGVDLLPRGTPVSREFWESPTIEELARSQGVRPIADVRALLGTWPGDEDDGFETMIDELRHPRVGRGDPS